MYFDAAVGYPAYEKAEHHEKFEGHRPFMLLNAINSYLKFKVPFWTGAYRHFIGCFPSCAFEEARIRALGEVGSLQVFGTIDIDDGDVVRLCQNYKPE